MGFLRIFFVFLVATVDFLRVHSQPMVPALNIFGDSVVDVGNNNNRLSLVKANFPPYGRDFVTHKPTGRFCNGKLAIDFTADYLGFTSYPPAYSSDDAKGRNILTGANFASAACVYYNMTSLSYLAISLPQQIENYKDWQNKVVSLVGKARATEIFSGAIHLLSAGSSDFIQNYYINPLLRGTYSTDRFSDILMTSFTNFVEKLYGLGVRRIGVTTLPPTGLPAAITLFRRGSNQCVPRLNADAVMFNNKLNTTAERLLNQFQDLKLVVFDIYKPLLELVMKPSDNVKERLLWDWYNRNISALQCHVCWNMNQCLTVCILGQFSSHGTCKQYLADAQLVYHMDPLKRRIASEEWTEVVDNGIKLYKENAKKFLKKKIVWENLVGIPLQNGSTDCGLFIMRYMKEISMNKEFRFATKWLRRTNLAYSVDDINEIRIDWAEYFTKHYTT